MDVHLLSNVLNKIASKYYMASGLECGEILAFSKYLQVHANCTPPSDISFAAELMLFRSYINLLNKYHEHHIELHEKIEASVIAFEVPSGFCSEVMREVLQAYLIDVKSVTRVAIDLNATGLCMMYEFSFQPAPGWGNTEGAMPNAAAALTQALKALAAGIWKVKLNADKVSVAWWR